MRVSYNWLKRYVDLKIDAAELAERFTRGGLEVEGIENITADIEGVVIGRVLEANSHAASDHISVCRVDAGNGETCTILCGAPNVAAGQNVALAKIGSKLPGGITIAAKPALGLVSEGMLCSKAELGLDKHDSAGIWVLPDDLPIGADLVQTLNLRDTVLELGLTPNRSDCLGMVNCAYEAAALTGSPVMEPRREYIAQGPQIEDLLRIEVEDENLCPRYVGVLVQGVKMGPSPLWMQNFLLAAGMRPINKVVDISNFVMLEMNQPLHTFDYQQLSGKRIIVREAKPGEIMQTLDGKERRFVGDEILICDAERPVCIGGIMGGMNSEVTDNTTDVLIEAACFHPTRIRRAARRLGIPSEASQRFEKGINIANCANAARRAAQLLIEYAGATAAQGIIDVGGQDEYQQRCVQLRCQHVNDLLGTDYTKEEIIKVMHSLSFAVAEDEKSGQLAVSIPSYRQDITLEEDLIEEVARLTGYDAIPSTLPASASVGYLSEAQQQRERLAELNVALGLYETINYSFISQLEAVRLMVPENHYLRKPLVVANPLTEEQSAMRLSLLPGLLNCAGRNQHRRNLDLALFELGSVYVPKKNTTEAQPDEIPSWGLLFSGSTPASWQGAGKPYDYFYAKGIIEAVAAAFHISGLSFGPDAENKFGACYLHPGRSATIFANGERLGIIGELHPAVAQNYELQPGVVVAELNLQRFFNHVARPGVQGLPKYPASERDLAFVGRDSIPAAAVEASIYAAGGALLQNVRLFDLYAGQPIAAGERSLAYALTFRAAERTLTDAEVDAAVKNIIETVSKEHGLRLRE